jgi:hypothetical protein
VSNSMGITPLMLAASNGYEETVGFLISGEAILETKMAAGSALFYACWYGKVQTAHAARVWCKSTRSLSLRLHAWRDRGMEKGTREDTKFRGKRNLGTLGPQWYT